MNPVTAESEALPSTQLRKAVSGDTLHVCLICLFFVFALQATAMNPPHNLAEARQLYDQGNAAFGAKKWQEALDYYGAVEQFLDKNPTFRNSFDHHFRGFNIMDTVQKRRALGEIKPEVTHRILVMFSKVDAPFPGGHVQAGIPPDLKVKAEASQEACARMVEVLSAGKVSLEFTRMELDATVTELSTSATLNNESDSVEVVHAVVESLIPYPAEIFRQNLDRYDTFLWYWNDQALRTTQGGGKMISRLPCDISTRVWPSLPIRPRCCNTGESCSLRKATTIRRRPISKMQSPWMTVRLKSSVISWRARPNGEMRQQTG